MHGNRPLKHCSRFFIVLLMLCVAVNGTRTVVLCLGSDGHVAIEMAGHGHCHSSDGHVAGGMAGHHHCEAGHCSDEAAHDIDTFVEEHHTCCGPHVEIPLSPGMVKGPGVQKMPEMKVLAAGIALALPDTADLGAEVFVLTRADPAFTSFYDPLRSIILIV